MLKDQQNKPGPGPIMPGDMVQIMAVGQVSKGFDLPCFKEFFTVKLGKGLPDIVVHKDILVRLRRDQKKMDEKK